MTYNRNEDTNSTAHNRSARPTLPDTCKNSNIHNQIPHGILSSYQYILQKLISYCKITFHEPWTFLASKYFGQNNLNSWSLALYFLHKLLSLPMSSMIIVKFIRLWLQDSFYMASSEDSTHQNLVMKLAKWVTELRKLPWLLKALIFNTEESSPWELALKVTASYVS